VSRLIRAAGYRGWLLLFDEVELIGRYSLLQRARAYAEVARWLDGFDTEPLDGMATVFAIVSDIDALIHEKDDAEQAPNRLRAKGDEALAARAERGIRILEREGMLMEPPSQEGLVVLHEALRALHARAHEWGAPPLKVALHETAWPMRQYVRAWITEWDLRRRNPDYRPELQFDELRPTFSEDVDLEGEDTGPRIDQG
jgi:hypothetical protein